MNLLKLIIIFISCLLFINNPILCQEKIYFKNPSFEASRGDYGTLPMSWDNCSTSFDYTSTDLHDRFSNFFGVRTRPIDGETFVGMVARMDGSYESIGQLLETPLQTETTYQFGIFIARSNKYVSISQSTRMEANFNEPIILRVWGGNDNCERKELLAETEPIEHRDWREYIFEFQPTADYKFLTFEAYFDNEIGLGFPYRGNILIDNCSDIMIIDTKPLNEIEDFSSLTNGKLLSLVLECKEADANLRDGSTLDIIFDSWHFNNKIKEVGLERLVTTLKPDLLSHYLDIYHILELEKPIKVISKTINTTKKTEKRLSDLRFLKGCDEDYTAAITPSELREKHLTFIEENRAEVIILLEACQEEE
jgi:hypothetical protein